MQGSQRREGVARLAGLLLAGCALVLFTTATISARAANTAAVLYQANKQSEAGLKLSYTGPLYDGKGHWQDSHGHSLAVREPWEQDVFQDTTPTQQLRTVAPSATKQQKQQQQQQPKPDSPAVTAARAAGLVFPPNHAKAGGKGISKTSKIGKSDPTWMGTEPVIAAGVRSVGKMFAKGAEFEKEFSDGFSKAFDVRDVAVHPKKPVKMLTHV
jgi:hypothetical protein